MVEIIKNKLSTIMDLFSSFLIGGIISYLFSKDVMYIQGILLAVAMGSVVFVILKLSLRQYERDMVIRINEIINERRMDVIGPATLGAKYETKVGGILFADANELVFEIFDKKAKGERMVIILADIESASQLTFLGIVSPTQIRVNTAERTYIFSLPQPERWASILGPLVAARKTAR